MYRCILLSLMVLTSFAPGAWGQERDQPQPGRRGLSLLYETAAGVRLNSRPGSYTPLYLSWEIGPMIHLGDWSGGATFIGIVEQDGGSGRWGVRSRVRRWIGGNAHLHIGAGVLLGGASRGSYYYDHPRSHSHSQVVSWRYPGFTGLVGVGYRGVGINLEVYAIPATQHDWYSAYWDSSRTPERGFTDWGVNLGLRVSGVGAVVVTALEALALGVAWAAIAASYQ
jgi:hypothetical protein